MHLEAAWRACNWDIDSTLFSGELYFVPCSISVFSLAIAAPSPSAIAASSSSASASQLVSNLVKQTGSGLHGSLFQCLQSLRALKMQEKNESLFRSANSVRCERANVIGGL